MSTPSTRSSTDHTETDLPRTIIRLGGSLLGTADIVLRLANVAAACAAPAIIVGGGASADQVRRWHAAGACSDAEAHWMAIAAMSLNAMNVADQHPDFRMTCTRADAGRILCLGKIPILDTFHLLRTESAVTDIPVSWDATSDSIAARVAVAWNCELLLLKPVDPGTAPRQHVDAAFPAAAASLETVGWLNVRQPDQHIIRLNIASF